MISSSTALVCPECAQPLPAQETDLTCPVCHAAARRIDGIPCFTDPDYYWGEIPREAMQEANRLAREIGWQAAVERVAPDQKDYICDPRRADFQHLWDLPRDATVLDVGAGWGAIATSLAAHFSRVVAVEGVLERARFIETRARQANLPVEVVCADFMRLPLAEPFDAVVLNGVLEWCAIAVEGDPREIQLRFLRKIRGLLKPGGFVCVGIENRIGWECLRGGCDHSGLRYTSLMPRKLAAWRCHRQAQRYRSGANTGYRTYTYSLPGYRKLFREAGYGAVRAFHAWDGYNHPTTLLPLDNPSALRAFAGQGHFSSGLRGRIKEAALEIGAMVGLWPQLASDFIFLIEKG